MNSSLPIPSSACKTLVELLEQRASEHPNDIYVGFLEGGKTEPVNLSYAELRRQACAIAAHLQALQLEGERALILFRPGLAYIAAFFGCLYANVVAIPAYPPHLARNSHSLERLKAVIANAQARIALISADIWEMIAPVVAQEPAFSGLHWIVTEQIDPQTSAHWRAPHQSGTTLAFLQYTSGSTAAPRGVMLSHANLLHNLEMIYRTFQHSTSSVATIWLPPYHDMGLIGGILQPLYGHFPVVLMPPLEILQRPFRWLEAISRFRVTVSGGPNFAYELCARRISAEQKTQLDLSSWKTAFIGAEVVRPQTLKAFAEAFAPCGFRKEAFLATYGLAEATLMVSGATLSSGATICAVETDALEHDRVVPLPADAPSGRQLVACGYAQLNQQIQIVHPETCLPCAPGQVGEIWVSGPSVAQGYWNNPTATENTFRAMLADRSAGPFLRTGDLGFFYEGELIVAGRRKDLMIINGRNLHPGDIEMTAERSHPAIRPGCCAAFSIEHNNAEQLVIVVEIDRRHFQALLAKPESDAAAIDSAEQDGESIKKAIRRAIVEEHNLSIYALVLARPGAIPKTSSGKIQHRACRAAFLSGELDVVGHVDGKIYTDANLATS